ncbi:hypothetical protein ACFV1B_07570 [Streptomyces sp. NPDC059637]|uniref:hypothetical protein n=1 Tax=Streptomyces sp. NPDC059637 TaxID=3347752 RepID=UPI003684BCE5
MKVEGFAADGYDAVRQVFQRLVDEGREPLEGHSRAAGIAAALGDDLSVVGED